MDIDEVDDPEQGSSIEMVDALEKEVVMKIQPTPEEGRTAEEA